jgi:starch synthase
MAPVYLRYGGGAAPPSLMTIHNIAFQGRFDAEVFSELGLPPRAFSIEGVEYFGGVGFLKGGMQSASAISTVSPTYAKEIASAEFGMGLEGLVNARRKDVFGILNGVDVSAWDPATDAQLLQNYDVRTIGRRKINKAAIEAAFGLDRDDGPLFCVVSRLTWQKGVDILIDCIDGLVAGGGRLAVLGAGDAGLEEALRAAALRAPGRIGARFGYDEALSHQMQGGADVILVPSRFEPCGLTQLYGLRYGCLPLVARTGGLADTVIDANDAAIAAGVATGVVMRTIDANGLGEAIERAGELYRQSALWRKMQRQAMKADVSWRASGRRYAALFADLIERSAS